MKRIIAVVLALGTWSGCTSAADQARERAQEDVECDASWGPDIRRCDRACVTVPIGDTECLVDFGAERTGTCAIPTVVTFEGLRGCCHVGSRDEFEVFWFECL